MQIIITGAAGFLGQRLAAALLQSDVAFDELLLVDIISPLNVTNDKRVVCMQADLSQPDEIAKCFTAKTTTVFHLAAIVSSHAEKDFDIGYKVNLHITQMLLEACRNQHTGIKFIFSSSLAVYGGKLPAIVDDTTAITPQSSYGTQKAIGELLVTDYSRKGFIDGRVLRLPTICVRPGRPNQAASSFVSSIIREPLNGEQAICPVQPGLALWLSSPDTIIHNIVHAAALGADKWGTRRTVNLAGVGVTVQEMMNSLQRITDENTVKKVQFIPDETIDKIVSSWPGVIDNSRALELGFVVDKSFDDFILQFIHNYKQQG